MPQLLVTRKQTMSSQPVEKLLHNLSIIANKYFQVYQKLINKKINNYSAVYDPLQLNQLLFKFFNKIFSDPELLIKHQMNFVKTQLNAINTVYQRFYSNEPFENEFKTDKRFKDKLWEEHSIFAWFKQAYFTYAEWVEDIIKQMPKDDFSALEMQRLNFITKQFLDAVAPNNFPSTNPEVLRAFFETAGENFIKGLDNLLHDIEMSKQTINIKTCDDSKFVLGENIAATPGKIVFQNEIMQLIHYQALKEMSHSIPILIVSPFINKYYVLDLHPEISFIKWMLENNHDVFLISWVNPDQSLSQKSFSDYVVQGPVAAIDYICKSLQVKQVNAMGYCVGGTLLTTTIAYMKAIQDNRIKSASFLTTLVDFAEAGDLAMFADDYSVQAVQKIMELSGGFLDGNDMSATFSLLRANDMIWPFYINNYLLGKEPFPFNLLYWNSDSVRIPLALHLFYLEKMYKDNLLKIPGGVSINKQAIDVRAIDVPCFVIAAKGDHIVPWQSAFNSAKLFTGCIKFVLSESGHVAGMINHPKQNKYKYWTGDLLIDEVPEAWFSKAKENPGSWWSAWNEWIKNNSGELRKAKKVEDIHFNIIENAPGSYVKVKC